jgi:hypothetical protein
MRVRFNKMKNRRLRKKKKRKKLKTNKITIIILGTGFHSTAIFKAQELLYLGKIQAVLFPVFLCLSKQEC